jgi:dipeptidyl aminopeptidase/acylaminoacyl peptidase
VVVPSRAIEALRRGFTTNPRIERVREARHCDAARDARASKARSGEATHLGDSAPRCNLRSRHVERTQSIFACGTDRAPRVGMNRTLALLAAPLALTACASTVRIPLRTTDAATALEQVTFGTANETRPTVSSDGKTLAYEALDSPGAPVRIEAKALGTRADGHVVAPGCSEPSWMPGGAGLVCVGREPSGAPRLMQAFGARTSVAFESPIAAPMDGTTWPAVSPDGRSIAVSFERSHLFETTKRNESFASMIAVVDFRGGLLASLGAGSEAAWSPDGKRLAFIRAPAERTHLFVANAQDGAAADQISVGSDDDSSPTWSPDGQMIAYCSSPSTDGVIRAGNVFVTRADGTELRQVTEGDDDACHPSWAPDGHLYFQARTAGKYHVWRLKVR